ncbi:tyrosine-type recombinase/integrase [Salinicola sp. V024]|uniref:tyrosine-type recombinase/integrase n=1 Tax=Salinicola sp. V024 TaxID=3459609 RepID=UPI004044C865
MPLTARKIESTKPADKVITLSDGSGLELRITPNGKRGWRFRYVRPDGSKRRNMISLGVYPTITLARARELALEIRRQLVEGIDPAEHRKAEKEQERNPHAHTFRVIAGEWHAGKAQQWKESSRRTQGSWAALERHVFPFVGDKGLDDISPMEWLELLRRLEREGKHEQKRKVHFFCRDVYRLAVVTGRASSNPLNDLAVALVRGKSKHMAHLDAEELPELVQAIEVYTGNELVKHGLKLLLLTAVRPGELRLAKWEEFDFNKAVWTIPADRMKMGRQHRVPLPRQAMATLRQMQRISGHYPHLFPSRNDATKIMSNMTFSMALKRMGFEGRHVPHGTRHTVATGLKEAGFPGEWIEMQLSHKLPGIQGVYTHAEHMAPEQRPAMMQFWADRLYPDSTQV